MTLKKALHIFITLVIAVALFFGIKYYLSTHSGDAALMQQLVTYVITHGYFLFFVAAFFEGPLITAAAGVACALGYYNISIIILISILGDLAPDAVFYALGYFGGKQLLHTYGHYIGMTDERIAKLKKLLHSHLRKTIVAVKLAPLIPVPGIIAIGSLRPSTRKFIETCVIITIPKSVLFALIGYYSGKAYQHASGLVANSEIIIFGLMILFFGLFLLYQKITFSLSQKMERGK